MTKPVILTGLRANNDLTLGNYFGGILPMIKMANSRSEEFQINMFIPDLHSFTTPIDHSGLYEQVIQTAKLFVAAGLPLDDPSIQLYRQSFVPAHSELTWIFDNFTGMGQMSRMTQFKDKSQSKDDVSVGLFNYPVLMAADILLYGAKYVPVGDDQTQHLEFTRDIAERMNARFGDLFIVPEPVKKQQEFFGNEKGIRVMDLVDPTKKMSKSDGTGRGVVFLSDKPVVAAKKIMSATTDDKGEIRFDPASQPGVSNLIEISSLLSGKDAREVASDMQSNFNGRYGDFKSAVSVQVQRFLEEFQARLSRVDDEAVSTKLSVSEEAMNQQANDRLLRVQRAIGLRAKV